MTARRPDRDALLVDAMCGKIATYLRMCGYDAAYALDDDLREAFDGEPDDDDLLAMARESERVIVTRDRQLAARAPETVLLESKDVTDQLRELSAAGLDLELADPPARCSACNGPLSRVDGGESTPEYAPDPAETAVWRCGDCGQCFWKGSHWDDVAATLSSLA